jgi:hypothetical protein
MPACLRHLCGPGLNPFNGSRAFYDFTVDGLPRTLSRLPSGAVYDFIGKEQVLFLAIKVVNAQIKS